MSASLAYRVLFAIPSAPLVIPSAVEESLPHRPEGRALRPFICGRGGAGSSSAATGITASVVIGASSANEYTQVQNGANSMSHLAGDYYPMYGIKNNVAKNKTPKFKMSHLFSVVAIKIVNEGDGDKTNGDQPLNISTIDFIAPEAVVGKFDINISGDEPVYTPSGNSSSVASLDLSQEDKSYISILPGESATVYLAVKPFDASNKDITLTINGSPKKVRMPINFKFEAGKVTTLKLPITHSGSKVTNAFNKFNQSILNWFGTKYLSFGDFETPTNAKINGEDVKIYTLGTEHGAGTLTLKGKPYELIQLLPAYFYAGSWGNRRTTMRINRVKVSVLGIGIDYDYEKLKGLVDETMITFDGLLPIDPMLHQNETGNIIITDEEPYHKKVDEAAVEKLLAKFDTFPNNPDDNIKPTFNGLKHCLIYPSDIDKNAEAKTTIDLIFDKAKSALSTRPGYESLVSLLDLGPSVLLSAMYLVDVTVEISTIATTAGQTTGDGQTLKDSRLVVWGMDVTEF